MKKPALNLSQLVASNPLPEYDAGLLNVLVFLVWPAGLRFGPTNLKAGYRDVEQLLPVVI